MRILVNDFAGHPFPIELSRFLARSGHAVLHTYCADNNTPKGRLDPGRDPFVVDAVRIARTFRKHSLLSRRSADLGYGRAVRERILAFRPDLAISANTPLDAQRILLDATHGCGGKFVFWLQDLLSAAIEFVVRKKGLPCADLLGRFYRRQECRLLQESDAIVCISPAFRTALEQWQVNREKIFVIENWAPLDEVRPLGRDTAWAAEQGLSGKFRFLYAGTLGMKHKPELLLELARCFEARKQVVTVVVAQGAGADWLRRNRHRLQPGALHFLPFQPYDRLSEVLAAGDVLVALLDEGCGTFAVPSKTLAYLCAGRPVLLASPRDNLAAEIVRSAGAGEAVGTSAADFLDAAVRLLENEPARELYSVRARAHAERNFAIDRIGQRFLDVFAFACPGTNWAVAVRI
jgi:glycosyltransferase involved in cell wall biosynthesis